MKGIAFVLGLFLFGLLQACQPPSATVDAIAGTWILSAVNGSTVSGGITATMNSNGTWSSFGSAQTPSSHSGTWTNNGGGSYSIVDSTVGGTYAASLSGNSMTITISSTTSETFTRQ